MARSVPSEAEIDEQMNRAADAMDNGTQYPGMSYEEGVNAALMWAQGHSRDEPMPDE